MTHSFQSDEQRVLIVDDERAAADMLGIVFRRAGYAVLVCHSGDDAIECARDFGPDLLVCDLNMPGMSGHAFASWIAIAIPSCQILLLTGDYLSLAKALNAGEAQGSVHAFLIKPQPPLVLLRAADRLLQSVKKRPTADLSPGNIPTGVLVENG